jgi:hypothetical protein
MSLIVGLVLSFKLFECFSNAWDTTRCTEVLLATDLHFLGDINQAVSIFVSFTLVSLAFLVSSPFLLS